MALRRTSVAVAACCVCSAGAWSASDCITDVPRFAPNPATAWQVDHPDGDDYIPPESGPGPVTFDPAHPFIPTDPASSIQPTYRIADVTNPILKPWAAEQMRKANNEVMNGKIPYVPRERCWPAGIPAYVLEPPFNITIFVETLKEILMIHQQGAEIRRIHMNVPHTANLKPSWTGESVGHWEGDTLVVDTIGLDTRTFVDNYRTPHTDKLHVVERYRLIEGGRTLEARITVDDPGAFNMPWSAVQRWRRTNRGPLEEISCSENNETFYHYDVLPIPQDDTPDF